MAKKPAPPAEPVTFLLPGDLHDDIVKLEGASGRVVTVEGEEVEVTADKLDSAVNVLALARAAIKRLDAEAKDLITKTVPKEVADKLAKIEKEKKSLKAKVTSAEDLVDRGLMSALALGTLTGEGYTSKAGCKLTVASRVSVLVTDLDGLADQFVVRTPDTKALQEALEADQRRRDAAKELDLPVPEPTVWGAELSRKFYFVTATPDIVE